MKRILHLFSAGTAALFLLGAARLGAQTPSSIVILNLPVYQQTSSSTETLGAVAVLYDVTFAPGAAGSGTTVQIQGPAGAVTLVAQTDGSYQALQSYASVAAANAALPNGTYTVTVGGATASTTSVSLSNGIAPSPVLITDYTALQSITSLPVTVAWGSIAGAKATDFIDLEIDAASGMELFGAESGDLGLTPTSTSLAIPALSGSGALAGNLTYASIAASGANNGQTLIETGTGFVVQFGLMASLPNLQSQTVAAGGAVVFNPGSTESGATYQYNFNGSPIPGATSATYVLNNAQAANAGEYTLTTTVGGASSTSPEVMLNVQTTSNPGRLVNISVRGSVSPGNATLLAGFVIGGAGTSGSEPILVRGVGPTLASFGVGGVLPDPWLQIWAAGSTTALSGNKGWANNSQISSIGAMVGAFPLMSGSADAAIYNSGMAAGGYSISVSGVSGDSGVALAEVYDATPASYGPTSPRLVNISGRANVGTGSNILVAGFVIGGATNETVLIRGSGPALASVGLTGTLTAPMLQVYASGSSTPEWTDTGWNNDPSIAAAAAEVGAFPFASGSADSAILVTLPPGAYSATMSGVNNGTGLGLVEVYEVP